jgi:hypothetical protein
MENSNALIGKFFVSKSEGKDKWQGVVVDKITDSIYLVHLFDWMFGLPSDMKLISVHDIIRDEWDLYEGIDELKARRPHE